MGTQAHTTFNSEAIKGEVALQGFWHHKTIWCGRADIAILP